MAAAGRSTAGQVRTFDELLDAHAAEILAYALRLTADRDTADDVFQETFLAAFRNLDAARQDNLRAWLYRIATNKAHDQRRRVRRQVRLEAAGDVPAPGRNGWLAADLERALATLPPGERAAFVLRRLQDLPYGDVARALDCSEVAARQRVSQATRKVREALR